MSGSNTAPFNDSLDSLFGIESSNESPKPVAPVETMESQFARIRETIPEFLEQCPSCKGSGRFISYSGRDCGPCFKCEGKGNKSFKTSPESREKSREYARNKKVEQEADNFATFKESFPIQWEWIERKKMSFDFALNMWRNVQQYGELRQGAMDAVNRCIEREKQFKSNQESRKVDIDYASIERALQNALNAGLKRVSLRIAGYVFSPAKENSRNPGAIYVKKAGIYLGKIMGGKFHPVQSCDAGMVQEIATIAKDVPAAAKAHGLRTGECSCCGRTLTDPVSISNGIGPICAGKFGF